MQKISKLIEQLRERADLSVVEHEQSWLVLIPKEQGMVCEVTIPHRVLEWFACVKEAGKDKELWSDWMDYSGYDDTPRERLESQMANDIAAFINRVSASKLMLPREIWKNPQHP